MPKVVYTSLKGLVQETGDGIDFSGTNLSIGTISIAEACCWCRDILCFNLLERTEVSILQLLQRSKPQLVSINRLYPTIVHNENQQEQ